MGVCKQITIIKSKWLVETLKSLVFDRNTWNHKAVNKKKTLWNKFHKNCKQTQFPKLLP